jgi:hypothetical protein
MDAQVSGPTGRVLRSRSGGALAWLGPAGECHPVPLIAPQAETGGDPGWPRAFLTPSGTRFVLYQPQIASWENQRRMVAYAAVSVESPGGQKPTIGTVKIEANTKVALDDRLVSFSEMALTEANLPELQKEQARDVVGQISKGLPAEDRVIALDRVLAYVDKSQITPKNVEGLNTDPPPIFFSQTPAVLVNIDGDPIWSPIQENDLKFAVNTDKDIITFGDLYYMCFQGVWFMSKKPDGPWEVCSSVPKEIYEIPASSPVNKVTYVTVVEEDSNDEWVTFATVAAYTGVTIAWGCAWWGGGYPYYYPRYPTYGAWYNPWTGGYGRAAVAYGPYGGAGVGARYNPTTGTYARGAVAYGPYGARGAAEAYNPRTGAYGQTRQGSGVYGSWGSTAVQRGDDWAKTSRVTNDRTGNTTRVTQGSGGGGGRR